MCVFVYRNLFTVDVTTFDCWPLGRLAGRSVSRWWWCDNARHRLSHLLRFYTFRRFNCSIPLAVYYFLFIHFVAHIFVVRDWMNALNSIEINRGDRAEHEVKWNRCAVCVYVTETFRWKTQIYLLIYDVKDMCGDAKNQVWHCHRHYKVI